MTFHRFLLFLLLYTFSCYSTYTLVNNDGDLAATPTVCLSTISGQPGLKNSYRPAVKDGTEIACEREAVFREKTNMAEFSGQVIVRDPQFKLCCDRLILTLRKDHQGIRHAEAVGNVVVIQENANFDGRTIRSIGRAGRVHYDPPTGNLFLTEWPQLLQGANSHIATGRRTRIILSKDGHSNTVGRSKTVIDKGSKDRVRASFD